MGHRIGLVRGYGGSPAGRPPAAGPRERRELDERDAREIQRKGQEDGEGRDEIEHAAPLERGCALSFLPGIPEYAIELEAEPSVEYGHYLSLICASCHGANLAGAPSPEGDGLNSANLTPSESGIGAWSMDDFMTALRTGIRPDGTALDPEQMPWPSFASMTDVEIQALYTYLTSLEPIENQN